MSMQSLKSSSPIFDDENPYDRVQLTLTWVSNEVKIANFIDLLEKALVESIVQEKMKAFGVAVLLNEDED